jgi:choice-of-anchor A domain-containing protein
MYRAGLACLLSAAVILGAVHCSSSEPGPGPAPAEANLRTAAQELTTPSCANSLDIHLSDYNLFLLEDYSEGHNLAGKVAAGGNITLDGFGVGSALPDDNVSNTLVAGGNLHLTNGNVFGATWYGGSYTPTPNWTVNLHRGTAAQGTPIDFAARFAELRSLSSRLATQQAPHGTTEPQWGNLYMTGTDPFLNVFDVNASDFQNAQGRNIEAPAGSFVVVNIHGTTLTFSRGISLSGGITPQRVLYNFVDATRIDASGFGLPGTVLAPYARLALNDGSWSGGIYAVSLRGNATGLLSPLEELAGAQTEVCNGVDDNCNGQVDEGFECSGSGSRSCTAWCGAAGTQTCDPATCGYGECTSATCCRADTDCPSGSYCEGNTCATQRENGNSCGSASQCSTGQCVDGVCCDTACTGTCDACNLEGSEGTCSPVPSTEQCSAGLVGYWSFDACSPVDDSGHGYHGVLNGSPTCVPGRSGRAYDFDPSIQENIQINNFPDITGSLTISMWARPSNLRANPYYGLWTALLAKGYARETYGISLEYNRLVLILNWNTPVRIDCAAPVIVQDGVFYHVATIYDYPAGKIRLYLNGSKVGECNYSHPIASNDEPLYFTSSYSGGADFFPGAVDEVRIYDRALSADEVVALYNAVP